MNPTEQAEAILELRHGKLRQADSVPARAERRSKMVKCDTKRLKIEDAKLHATADEQFVADMMEYDG